MKAIVLVGLGGLVGGFTTFSAFGLDALYLVRRGEMLTAASYAGLSVIVGIAAVWLGFKLVGGSLHHT
jgi:CrcB protein